MKPFQFTFERSLDASARKQNIPFPFQVPAGTTTVNIRLSYSPHVVDGFNNMLTLTVFDPHGWRGSGHRHGTHHQVFLREDRASPGYVPGPIPPGTWTATVDTHMVMPGPKCEMRLEISGTDAPVKNPQPQYPAGHTARRGPGWYRGDLHAHSTHSDAHWDVAGLVAYARRHQLDFATLSDHNTVAGLPAMFAAADDSLLTMGGMELTTFWGHALVLGIHHWINWQLETGKHSMAHIQQEVAAQGGTFIIAHPGSVGDPYCTGCQWEYPELMPGSARCVEVWNGEWVSDANNEASFQLACQWMNQGYRMALTAGTDNHGDRPNERPYPSSVVYAQELSERGILAAVQAGHLYLSRGPRLQLEAGLQDQHAMMGDVVYASEGSAIQVNASWEDCSPGAQAEWIVDGRIERRFQPDRAGSQQWNLPGGKTHWALFALRDAQGNMLALTNPIYFDGRI